MGERPAEWSVLPREGRKLSRDILISPPRLIDPAQRIKYGAILGLTEMAETAFKDLRELAIALAAPKKDGAEDPAARHRALTLAWSIVDQADLLRELIISEGSNISLAEAERFLNLADPIRDMRNWLRHIPQRVGNYLAASRPVPPVLGALSFTVLCRWEGGMENDVVSEAAVLEYHTVVLINTSFERDGGFEGEPIKYERFRHPVDHFVLQAFGRVLPLDSVVEAISAFCDAFAAGVTRWVESKIEEMRSEEQGIEFAGTPLYEHGAAIYRMIARRD